MGLTTEGQLALLILGGLSPLRHVRRVAAGLTTEGRITRLHLGRLFPAE